MSSVFYGEIFGGDGVESRSVFYGEIFGGDGVESLISLLTIDKDNGSTIAECINELVINFTRSHVPTLLREHVNTYTRSHCLTFSLSHDQAASCVQCVQCGQCVQCVQCV